MEKKKKILIVAGEASGDMHAARLVAAIQAIAPATSFFGLGGAQLEKQNVRLSYDLTRLAVVGFWEVLRHLRTFSSVFRSLLEEVDSEKPDAAILVDYPGFNLRLAQQLHKRKIPVIYYSSPQVWAWGKKRMTVIKKAVSRMIVFFPFEETLYRSHGVAVSFVGHPLLDMVKPAMAKETIFRQAKLKPGRLTVALLPGSREKEVKNILPIMLQSASIIAGYLADRVQFIVLRAPTVKKELVAGLCSKYALAVTILSDPDHSALAASDFALVCSGTATLETAILAVPMVIIYTVNFLSWLFIRLMIRIPYIGLVNVVRGKKIVEEFIQFDAQAERIADYIIPFLHDADERARAGLQLRSIKSLLGEPGACARAARIIVDMLEEYPSRRESPITKSQ